MMMRAIVQQHYGLPDVLELREVARPSPRGDEVLVRVRACSVNRGDWIFMTGRPYPVRLFSGLLRPKQPVLGMDLAGVVEAVGPEVRHFAPGDEVYGETNGAYAEFACVAEHRIARKPDNLSFEQAAAVPVAAVPALLGLRDKAAVQPGQHVLVNGASGGVGTFAVQIAKAMGARVTGVCSTRNVAMVRAIGADDVVDYTREDFTHTAQRYDVVFDLVGSASIGSCRRLLTPNGIYLSSVGRTGWALKAALWSLLPKSRVAVLAADPNAKALDALTEFIEAGTVTPVLDRSYALHQVREAMRYQGEGHTRGKTTIFVA